MKTGNFLTVTFAATLALAACGKSDEPGEPTRDQVNITTSIGRTSDSGTGTGQAPGSRVTLAPDGSGSFDASDVLGLYATTGGTAKLTNASYTAGSTLYWDDLSTTAPVTFAAYYPHTATVADPAAYAFNVATATEKDLLLATPDTRSKGETVKLAFGHAMHRLVVKLTSSAFTGEELAAATFTLKGMKSTAAVNILTGTVDAAAASGSDAYAAQTVDKPFVVAPQAVTTGADWIVITMDGKQYTYKMPAQITNAAGTAIDLKELESGKTLTLNLAITRDGITLTTGDIAAWDTQGKIDGEIDFGSGVPVASTAADLQATIDAATDGTAANPTVIKLGANIAMGDNDHITIGATIAPKYIQISGNGKTITKGSAMKIFDVTAGSVLMLTDVTLDGANAASGDFLVGAKLGSTVILGDGAILQNLKNWEYEPGWFFRSTGVSLVGASTLVMNSGASIKGIEGYAINSNDNTLNQIRLNGGSISGSEADIFVIQPNSASAVIRIAAMPTLDGGRKMNVILGYAYNIGDTCPIIAPEDGSSPALRLNDFTFTVQDYNSAEDITVQCDIFLDTDGIIKIRKK